MQIQDMEKLNVVEINQIANRIRCNILKTISHAGVGHPGGSLSEVEILTVLFFSVMNIDPQNPNDKKRDRFILSKGHGAAGLYSTMAERGFLAKEELATFGQINSRLQVHPDMHKLPGIEISTGALGQGLSIAVGMAMAAKLDKLVHQIYCLIGDGESQEGQVWEAAEAAAHYQTTNLTVILDYNKVQLMGVVEDTMPISPIAQKWRSFNWNVIEIDGHNAAEISAAINSAKECHDKPTIIIANTIKGKGVSFMEGNSAWHGKSPDPDQLASALQELGCSKFGGSND